MICEIASCNFRSLTNKKGCEMKKRKHFVVRVKESFDFCQLIQVRLNNGTGKVESGVLHVGRLVLIPQALPEHIPTHYVEIVASVDMDPMDTDTIDAAKVSDLPDIIHINDCVRDSDYKPVADILRDSYTIPVLRGLEMIRS